MPRGRPPLPRCPEHTDAPASVVSRCHACRPTRSPRCPDHQQADPSTVSRCHACAALAGRKPAVPSKSGTSRAQRRAKAAGVAFSASETGTRPETP